MDQKPLRFIRQAVFCENVFGSLELVESPNESVSAVLLCNHRTLTETEKSVAVVQKGEL